MEDLYLGIFDVSNTPAIPYFKGFSYGMLMVVNGNPVYAFYVDDNEDDRLQFLMENGKLQIFSNQDEEIRIYYGYVTNDKMFYCEQQVFPNDEEEDDDSETDLL